MNEISDILRAGRDRIMEPTAWCSGAWTIAVPVGEDPSNEAQHIDLGEDNILNGIYGMMPVTVVKHCSDGALRWAVAQHLGISTEPVQSNTLTRMSDAPMRKVNNHPLYQEAVTWLLAGFQEWAEEHENDDGIIPQYESIPDFNDPHRHAEVMEGWDWAIKRADEAGA